MAKGSNGKEPKRVSKRKRSGATDAADESARPGRKKAATGKASTDPSHSSDDVTIEVASTSRGLRLEAVMQEPSGDDADELMMESADNLSGSLAASSEHEDQDEVDDVDEGDTDVLEEEAEGSEEEDDDDDSYDSQIEGDLQTNVDGAEEISAADRATLVSLQGVKFFDDDEVSNAARSNMNRLLRNKRYHDDDVSEPMVRHSVGPRCFKCGLPGHVAADCPAPPQQPCNLCAGFGHMQAECPKAMCYRCQGFGHSLRDCYLPEAKAQVRSCVRCGQQACKAGCQGDWYRFMEGCNKSYSKSDLRHVRCLVCGQTGHFSCKRTPEEPVEPTCCLCGEKGHTGQLNDCPGPLPKVLAGEIASESSRSRNRTQPPAHTRHDTNGGRTGAAHDAPRYGARSDFPDAGRRPGGSSAWDGDGQRQLPPRRPHQGHTQHAHQFSERAPRVVPSAVHGYGPNSRHGKRDSGRGGGSRLVQHESEWGSARRSSWHDGGIGGGHLASGRGHGGAQHAAPMHPPPDQAGYHAGMQPVQQLHLPPNTVILQAPGVHTAPAHVQQNVLYTPLHAGALAPPPDVQRIQRHTHSYDPARAGAAHHQDDLAWRGQWHVRMADDRSRDGSRSDYWKPHGHHSQPPSHSRSHRRY